MNGILEWRLSRGWTQAEIADLTGMSQPTVHRWETGQREPEAAVKIRIARRLGARVSDLWDAEPVE